MSYFKILGLEKEPFSTSPDPEFLFRSTSHETVLKRLEISLRLRRGLNLILGDVGTGKTTLSRALLQMFKDDPVFIFHMVLDPGYTSEYQFLSSLVKMFGISPYFKSTLDFKEALERHLFQKCVEENKTAVLIIDEAQKINMESLEVLRTLLNFETNTYKLLQVVLMAQSELLPRLMRIRNFMDRVTLKYTINPLDENETREMIGFRLRKAGYCGRQELFREEAIKLIYRHTQGYPRRIAMLCHEALKEAVMRELEAIGPEVIDRLIGQETGVAHEG